MGLLGEVTNAEVEEALKPKAGVVFDPDKEYPFIVQSVSELKSGPKGDYYTATLLFERPEIDDKTTKVWHTVSLSPTARGMVIQFLNGVGINPNQWDDPSELVNCTGRAVLKVAYKPNGDPKNEVKYFKKSDG